MEWQQPHARVNGMRAEFNHLSKGFYPVIDRLRMQRLDNGLTTFSKTVFVFLLVSDRVTQCPSKGSRMKW